MPFILTFGIYEPLCEFTEKGLALPKRKMYPSPIFTAATIAKGCNAPATGLQSTPMAEFRQVAEFFGCSMDVWTAWGHLCYTCPVKASERGP